MIKQVGLKIQSYLFLIVPVVKAERLGCRFLFHDMFLPNYNNR